MCVFIKFTCVLILLAPRRKYIFYETWKHRHISGDGFTTSFRNYRFRTIEFGWKKWSCSMWLWGKKKGTLENIWWFEPFQNVYCCRGRYVLVNQREKNAVYSSAGTRRTTSERQRRSPPSVNESCLLSKDRFPFCFVRFANRYYNLDFFRRSTVVTDLAPCIRLNPRRWKRSFLSSRVFDPLAVWKSHGPWISLGRKIENVLTAKRI